MIQAKDLRIGNIIQLEEDSTKFLVYEITGSGFSVRNKNEDTWIENWQFEGVPLTEEILLKCNIEDCGMAWSLSDEFDIILQESDNKGLWTLANVFVDSYSKSNYLCMGDAFQYVHQLQNLYFALTNTELEINL